MLRSALRVNIDATQSYRNPPISTPAKVEWLFGLGQMLIRGETAQSHVRAIKVEGLLHLDIYLYQIPPLGPLVYRWDYRQATEVVVKMNATSVKTTSCDLTMFMDAWHVANQQERKFQRN